LKYSPCGKLLAITSIEGFLDIYDCSSYVKKFSLKENSSHIICFDWSNDSKYIAANLSEEDLIYFNAENGTKVTKKEIFRNIEWSTQTRLYAWDTQGIWEKLQNQNPNNIDLYKKEVKGEKVISVGFDDGSIKLYK